MKGFFHNLLLRHKNICQCSVPFIDVNYTLDKKIVPFSLMVVIRPQQLLPEFRPERFPVTRGSPTVCICRRQWLNVLFFQRWYILWGFYFNKHILGSTTEANNFDKWKNHYWWFCALPLYTEQCDIRTKTSNNFWIFNIILINIKVP